MRQDNTISALLRIIEHPELLDITFYEIADDTIATMTKEFYQRNPGNYVDTKAVESVMKSWKSVKVEK